MAFPDFYTGMFKGTCASSSSSDSSEDEGEGITLAQLNREKRSAPEDKCSDVCVPSVQTEGDSEQEEEEEEELQVPRELEEVLVD